MERFTQFGLRGDADEQFCRAVRDGFKNAGLSHAQLTQAMEWYRDHGQRLGGDAAKITESFAEFAAANRWPVEHRDAAVSVYGHVRDQGPASVMAVAPPAAEDAATIARVADLLRTDPAAYWRDVELQEAQYEALERQGSAATPAEVPTPTAPAVAPGPPVAPTEGLSDRQRHDEIISMMRDPGRAREYWGGDRYDSSGECFRAQVSFETDLGMRQSERRERIKADPVHCCNGDADAGTSLHR